MSVHYENADLTLNPGTTFNMSGNIVTPKIGIGTILSGASAVNVFDMAIGVEPSTQIADQIAIFAKDSSVGTNNATLALSLEADPVAIGTFTESHKFPVWINGVEYHISLDAV